MVRPTHCWCATYTENCPLNVSSVSERLKTLQVGGGHIGSEGPQETQGLSTVVAGETWHPLHAEWPELPGEGAVADGHMAPAGDPPGQSVISRRALAAYP